MKGLSIIHLAELMQDKQNLEYETLGVPLRHTTNNIYYESKESSLYE
jgi:hypothetical protein